MRRYKFVLAFENAVQSDYVTEKFYIPLMAGSVPVYLGAPNIQRFAPDPASYIDVAAFPSPHALAQHLLHLHAHPAEYARLHAWRDRPWRPEFVKVCVSTVIESRVSNNLIQRHIESTAVDSILDSS